ncbi:MAG: hypothetical protein AMXMBFR13_36550 [Phycisphaerae bacterium]
MGKLNLTPARRRIIGMSLALLTLLLAADLVHQAAAHQAWGRWIDEKAAPALPTTRPATTQPAGTQPADTQPASQPAGQAATPQPRPGKDKQAPRKPIEVSAVIRKRNIFGPPKVESHGMSLAGVMGKFAIFRKGGGTVSVEEGKSEGGVTVKSINEYEVTIEYKGKTETMRLFAGGSGPPPVPGGGMPTRGEIHMGGPSDQPIVVPSGGPGGPGPIRIEGRPSPEEIRKLIESRRGARPGR